MSNLLFRFVSLAVVVILTIATFEDYCLGKEYSHSTTASTSDKSTESPRKSKDTQAYERFLDFSGYQWGVKLQRKPIGPGPNYFSDREEDIWVDDAGLHLTISQRDGKWYCTEAILQESFGYGTYIFQTKTEPEHLDANVVAGMFTWEAGLPWPNRELDFEFARWGDPDDATNCQYVIQPFTTSGNMVRYRVAPDEQVPYLTQIMTWQKGKVEFTTARGRFDSPQVPAESTIISWTYTGKGVPDPGQENPRINLWLNDGNPPTTDKPIELEVTKFIYLPLEK